MRSTHVISIGLVAALTFVACGGDEPSAGPASTDPVGSTIATTPSTVVGTPPTTNDIAATVLGRGWIGGEPAWSGARGAEDMSAMVDGDMASAEAMVEEPAATPGMTAAPGEEVAGGSPLRAGSVDDNADFQAYLDYLERIRSLGIALRPFDPTGRIVVSVRGADGRPMAGATVDVTIDGAAIASLVTTADGSARFLPALYGQPVDGSFTFATGGMSTDAAAGGTAELTIDRPGGTDGVVALDVLFLLDATGSMGDEIDQLKSSIDSVAERVAALEGAPDVRFAMTLYRDEGDAFVSASYDFTGDVDAFRTALADVVADGGGDYPEALDEGLAEALDAPEWRDPATTVQLVFLVADAPPQVGRQVETPYPDSIRDAVGRGIKIFPVASSESDDQAEAVFRQIAQATGARFVFLTYGAGGAATGGSTDIDRTDYEELALDDLVVRLVAEEVAALTGDGGVVPPPTPTTTTVPDGQ